MVCFVGILREDGSIDNVASIKRLAEISVTYAKAGMLDVVHIETVVHVSV